MYMCRFYTFQPRRDGPADRPTDQRSTNQETNKAPFKAPYQQLKAVNQGMNRILQLHFSLLRLMVNLGSRQSGSIYINADPTKVDDMRWKNPRVDRKQNTEG